MQDYHSVHEDNNMQDYHSVQEYLDNNMQDYHSVHEDNNMQDYHSVQNKTIICKIITLFTRIRQ